MLCLHIFIVCSLLEYFRQRLFSKLEDILGNAIENWSISYVTQLKKLG